MVEIEHTIEIEMKIVSYKTIIDDQLAITIALDMLSLIRRTMYLSLITIPKEQVTSIILLKSIKR
jgi:hypothetical protein